MTVLRASLMLSVCLTSLSAFAAEPSADAILKTYADIALAGYEDALTTAKALDTATDALIANPSEESLKVARDAWRAARPWYQQTEAFRFGSPIVVQPGHWVSEQVVEDHEAKHRRRQHARRALGSARHQFHTASRSFALGAVLSATVGLLASVPLIARILFPRLAARVRSR